jgi:hypothetical protein
VDGLNAKPNRADRSSPDPSDSGGRSLPSQSQPTRSGGSEQTLERYTSPWQPSTEEWKKHAGCPRCSCLVGRGLYTTVMRFIPIRCRCWSCHFCRKKNLSILQARILEGQPERFLTLTTRPLDRETPRECYIRCRPAVSRLFAELRRRYGEIEGVIVLETTKKGYPHWHCLIRGSYIPQSEISQLWHRFSGAFIIDIRRIKGKKDALIYSTKYILKAANQPQERRLGRLYSFTRNYSIAIRASPKDRNWVWERCRTHVLEELRCLRAGWNIVQVASGWEAHPRDEKVRAAEESCRIMRLNRYLMERDIAEKNEKLARTMNEPRPPPEPKTMSLPLE